MQQRQCFSSFSIQSKIRTRKLAIFWEHFQLINELIRSNYECRIPVFTIFFNQCLLWFFATPQNREKNSYWSIKKFWPVRIFFFSQFEQGKRRISLKKFVKTGFVKAIYMFEKTYLSIVEHKSDINAMASIVGWI